MKLRIVLFSLALVGLVLLVSIQDGGPEREAKVMRSPGGASTPLPSARQDFGDSTSSPAMTASGQLPPQDMRSPKNLRSTAQMLGEMGVPSLWDVRKDLDVWLEGAKGGRPKSAIGFFLATENCQRFRRQSGEPTPPPQLDTSGDCSRVDVLDYGRRGEFIRAAAQTGDPLAGLLFAKGAPTMVAFAKSKDPSSPDISAIRFEAMRALEGAASAGAAEAYTLLASYYASGTLGVYDLGRAYAYASVVAKGDVEAQAILSNISAKMRPGEIAAGKALLAKLQ